MTIYPQNEGDRVRLEFSMFELDEPYFTTFTIYNGENTDAPVLYDYISEDTPPLSVSSTDIESGALTVYFYNDWFNEDEGWAATVICEEMPICGALPQGIVAEEIGPDYITVSWLNWNQPDGWIVELVPTGATPSGSGTFTIDNSYTFEGLMSQTAYDIYVVAVCGDQASETSLPITVQTKSDYCGADVFNDMPWDLNIDTILTIYPKEVGSRVKVVFNDFYISDKVFSVFNGASTDAAPLEPHQYYPGGPIPDTLYSTDLETGALTFVVTGNIWWGNVNFDAVVECEPMPSCAIVPSFVDVVETTMTSAVISWSPETGDVDSWEVVTTLRGEELVEENIVTVESSNAVITNLTSGTYYDVYVRAVCSDDKSQWSYVEHFNTVSDFCGGDHFYDLGGPNEPHSHHDVDGSVTNITTIYPSEDGGRVKVTFNTLSLGENSWMYIYNGDSTDDEQLGYYNSESDILEWWTSTDQETGALTFRFVSNSSVEEVASGWDATVECEPYHPCPNIPFDIEVIDITMNTAYLSWDVLSSTDSWEVDVVAHGAAPDQGEIITHNHFPLSGLSPNTIYDVYVRMLCDDSVSEWSERKSFSTLANYCDGDIFYNTATATGNLDNGEYIQIIYPNEWGQGIQAVVNDLNLVGGNAKIVVYDGDNLLEENIIAELTNQNYTGIELMANQPNGALTFQVLGEQASTWDISINCIDFTSCDVYPIGISFPHIQPYKVLLNWELLQTNHVVEEWDISYHLLSDTTIINTFTTDQNAYWVEGLEPNTSYVFKIRNVCEESVSSYSQSIVKTSINYCGGHFYDTGGSEGDYAYNQNYTTVIYPEEEGQRVRAIFNSFETASYSDNLKIYDGPDSSYPLLYTCYGTNAPVELVSSDLTTGALTFVFQSNLSGLDEGWDISIACEPFEDCTPINHVQVISASLNEIVVDWGIQDSLYSWEIEVVLVDSSTTGIGIPVDELPYTISNLTPNTEYHVYVKTNCTGDSSTVAGPFSVSTTPDYCNGDHFYDTGGESGNYSSNEEYVVSIYPQENTQRIRAVFNTFKTRENDILYVYDGPTTSYPLLYTCEEDEAPYYLESTDETGALTFEFISDVGGEKLGWDISIYCEDKGLCNDEVVNPTVIYEKSNELVIGWDAVVGLNEWEIKVIQQQTDDVIYQTITTDHSYVIENLIPETDYYVFVRGICSVGTTDWVQMLATTAKDYCGSSFYDSGGANSSYSYNEYSITTIYPAEESDVVEAIFNNVELKQNGVLKIYDGSSIYDPLLYVCEGVDFPEHLIATHSTGALTFEFSSHLGSTGAGWDISIECIPRANCTELVEGGVELVYASFNSITVAWNDNTSDYDQWEVEVIEIDNQAVVFSTITSSNSLVIPDLDEETNYIVRLRGVCALGEAYWSEMQVTTIANYCESYFYDTGGQTNNYSNDDDYLVAIFPENAGDRIRAVFETISLSYKDTLYIYDGPNTTYPLLYACYQNNYPEELVSSETATGALTFRFISRSYSTSFGWEIFIECSTAPDCPEVYENMTFTSVKSYSMDVGWYSPHDIESWEIEVVESGGMPSGSGTIVSEQPYHVDDLLSETAYDFYIRSFCEEGESVWSGPFTHTTLAEYCDNVHFYDLGGPNNDYPSGVNYTKTIYPDGDDLLVKASFEYLILDSDDRLYVYDGPDNTYPLLYTCTNNDYPEVLVSSETETGALTFFFAANANWTYEDGWDIVISCEDKPICTPSPYDMFELWTSSNAINTNWSSPTIYSTWEIEYVLSGESPSGVGQIVDQRPYVFDGLVESTSYDFYIRGICEQGTSGWTGPYMLSTTKDYCGSHFYDTGGANGYYSPNEFYKKTITPNEVGDRVSAKFNLLDLGSQDVLYIYSGVNEFGTLLHTCTWDDAPSGKIIPADSLTAALTFVFESNGSSQDRGWDISIECEPIPDCFSPPSSVELQQATITSLDVSWESNNYLTSWEVEMVEHGVAPTGSGQLTQETSFFVDGLESDTPYQFYVRGLCVEGFSEWIGPFTFKTLANYCGGDHFYDTGGPNSNYGPNQNYATTIYPSETGQYVRAVFNQLTLSSGDTLRVYDGPDSSYPLLFNCVGTNYPSDVSSSEEDTGALTFEFTSDNYYSNQGWDISFICEQAPTCTTVIDSFNITNITTSFIALDWVTNEVMDSFEVEILVAGDPITGQGQIVTTNTFSIENLTSYTNYVLYVRGFCGEGTSLWSNPVYITTLADYCGGDHFYDNGGPNGPITANAMYTTTIYPDEPGQRIRAIFNSFDIGNSHFLIYDGPDETYPLLYDCTYSDAPDELFSLEPNTGALTFAFFAGSWVYNDLGWNITIICEDQPDCFVYPDNMTFADITKSSMVLDWESPASLINWEIEMLPTGQQPTGTGMLVTEKPYALNDLTSNTTYDFYIRGNCEAGVSDWTGPFTAATIPDYCAGEHFYDTGGPTGNYSSNESYVVTIYPEEVNDRIRAVFNNFYTYNESDYLRIYNGDNIDAPLMYQCAGADFPSELLAVNPTGALTFKFFSSSSGQSSGWDISIVCEEQTDCFDIPTNITFSEVKKSSVVLDWDAVLDFSSWEIEAVLEGQSPIGEGITTTSKPYLYENLLPNTTYQFYIRGYCDEGTSDWAGPFTVTTSIDYCSGELFYDTGGPDNEYEDNEEYSTTIYPDQLGDRVRIIFDTIDLGYDATLKVYNGPDETYPLIATYDGNDTNATVVSTEINTGALTIVFLNDGWSVGDGWEARVICEPIPDCLYPPFNITFADISDTEFAVNWESPANLNAWEVEIVLANQSPLGEGEITNELTYTFTDLVHGTAYDIYIRGYCEQGTSEWVGPFTISTLIDYCSGYTFYDTGGPDGDYGGDEEYSKTMIPLESGTAIKATFNHFEIDYYDDFYVYDGPDDSYPLLYNCTSNDYPNYLVASNDMGALTFVFESGYSVEDSGWDISIECVQDYCSPPTNVNLLSVTTSSITFDWASNDAQQWEVVFLHEDEEFHPNMVGEIVNQNSYTATGLQIGQNYNAYVRSICNLGYESDWSAPGLFNVGCLAIDAPYLEEFETESIPMCWNINSGANWVFNNELEDSFGTVEDFSDSNTTNYVWYDDQATDSATDFSVLYLPTIDISSLAHPALQFALLNRNITDHHNVIKVQVTYQGSWADLDVITEATTDKDWELFTYDLSGAQFSNWVDLRFYVANNIGTGGFSSIAIDDIQFGEFDELVISSADIKLNEYQITCYPNPTHNEFTLSSTTPMEVVQLIDAMGKTLVQPTLVDKYSNIIDLSDYAAGLYFVKVTFENGSQTTQAIVKE